MSRLILLLILAVWLIGAEGAGEEALALRPELAVFLGGYVMVVMIVALRARMMARGIITGNVQGVYRRFNRILYCARWMIPSWLFFGMFGGAGWGEFVTGLTGVNYQLPGALLGTFPAFAAWAGLWWAEYPIDRAMREQNLLSELWNDLPVHAPPPFGRYLSTNLRQQLLPVILPILLILSLRDAAMLVAGQYISPAMGELVTLLAMAVVYLASPAVLRRIFNTRPLDDSPLRRRLEEICRRGGLRYRDILLWQTDYSMANACVFGLLPGWRYVLLSDRLLETMTDEQIEAVFAHEMGHMVHHHMAWFVVFFAVLALGALGPGQFLDNWSTAHLPKLLMGQEYQDVRHWIGSGLTFGGMLMLLGMLSRRFERQADVFAARMMETNWGKDCPVDPATSERQPTHVGRRGAELFNSALHRVAVVNNIPLAAKDWFHPSISWRIRYLEELAANPAKTGHFDRRMGRLYAMLVTALVVFGACAMAVWRM